jgi:hypothetical protein
MIQQPEQPGEQPPAASAGRCVTLTLAALALVVCVVFVRGWALWITPLLAAAFINEVWRRRAALRSAERAVRRLPR